MLARSFSLHPNFVRIVLYLFHDYSRRRFMSMNLLVFNGMAGLQDHYFMHTGKGVAFNPDRAINPANGLTSVKASRLYGLIAACVKAVRLSTWYLPNTNRDGAAVLLALAAGIL
jgi:hypothetical protein